jgi:octanoyl-[GcvH]:protein N-octanoyltransferase
LTTENRRQAVELVEGRVRREPALELALSAALLTRVASDKRPSLLRVYVPSATVAFGRRDTFLPGFARAASAAVRRGFTPVVRSAGGRAAAYDDGCLILEEIMRVGDSASGIQERFAAEAERQAEALRQLGVDARVGEVPGEYCPGEFTVNAGGATKLIGAAQRVIRDGWMLSSVVVVASGERLRAALEDVYAALALDWDPATVGAVADEAPGVGIDEARRSLLETYADRYELVPGTVTEEDVAAATALLSRHRVRV